MQLYKILLKPKHSKSAKFCYYYYSKSINHYMKLCKKIAIIDSGIGGISILKKLIEKYNYGNFIYFADNLNMPYGNKSKEFLTNRIDEIITMLKEEYKVDMIIIACNTASSVIDKNKYSSLITMKFKKEYTYFATVLTKNNLKDFNVIADNTLAKLIEKHIFNRDKLEELVKCHIKKYKLNELESFVLGCTHYELVKDLFVKYCPNTKVISNIDFVLEDIKLEKCDTTNVFFLQSKKSLCYNHKMNKLIGRG